MGSFLVFGPYPGFVLFVYSPCTSGQLCCFFVFNTCFFIHQKKKKKQHSRPKAPTPNFIKTYLQPNKQYLTANNQNNNKTFDCIQAAATTENTLPLSHLHSSWIHYLTMGEWEPSSFMQAKNSSAATAFEVLISPSDSVKNVIATVAPTSEFSSHGGVARLQE